MITFLFV